MSALGMTSASRPLLPLAAIWTCVGWTILSVPDPDPTYRLPLEHLPVWARVAAWWVPAACAVLAAWWPRARPRWGFMALMLPAGLRVGSYAAALPWHPGLARDLVLWVAICGLVLLFAEGSDHRHDGERR